MRVDENRSESRAAALPLEPPMSSAASARPPVLRSLPASEPKRTDPFVPELSGPGAMQLVVELVHDLRLPLTAILCTSDMLMRGRSGGVNDLQRRQLEMVHAAAFGLSALANDVVELAEAGGRLADTEPAALSVKEVIESVADMVRPVAEDKGLDIRVIAPADDLRVGHRSALSRVLLNLGTNALRATDQGHVEISATPSPNGRLRFSVLDTGPGIAAGALASLARPFRGSGTPGEYLLSHTGLGLTICQKLLQAMDSQLEVETWPGRGTRFHFGLDLPVVSPPPTLVGDIVRAPFPTGPAASATSPR